MAIINHTVLQQARKLLVMSPFALGDFLYVKTFLTALAVQYPQLTIDIWLDDDRNDQQPWRLSRSRIMQQWIDADAAFGKAWGCCASATEQQRQIAAAAAEGYDIVVTIPGTLGRHYLSVARQIGPGALLVSGQSKSRWGRWLGFWFYRQADAVARQDTRSLPRDHHITDRYYLWVQEVFGLVLDKAQFMPTLMPPAAFICAAKQWVATHFAEQQGPLVFLNHLSTNSRRDWSLTQLFALIEALNAQMPRRFIINVTAEHFADTQAQLPSLPAALRDRVVLFTVNGHFFELPAIISCCDLVVSVETAIMHFATALQRPLVALMRQKKPYWAPPANPQARVLFASTGKGYVSDIPVTEVLAACGEISKR